MHSFELDAHVDEQGRLVLDAPLSLPPGRVRVTVNASPGDAHDDDVAFRGLTSALWTNSLADPAEDVYTDADGVPIDPVTGEPARL